MDVVSPPIAFNIKIEKPRETQLEGWSLLFVESPRMLDFL